MAKDIDEEINEEEEYENQDADDIEEQENPKEYEDLTGENLEPNLGFENQGMEYICPKCGKKKRSAGIIIPSCHGKMVPLDFEETPKKTKKHS